VARELARQPRVLVAVNPTRGVDVAAVARIRAEITEQKSRGAAILLISTDLDEIIELADRIGVLVAGRFIPLKRDGKPGREHVGRLMLGVSSSQEHEAN